MITTAELHRVAEKEGLRFDQTEKDYVILWILSGLVHSGAKDHGWVFKHDFRHVAPVERKCVAPPIGANAERRAGF